MSMLEFTSGQPKPGLPKLALVHRGQSFVNGESCFSLPFNNRSYRNTLAVHRGGVRVHNTASRTEKNRNERRDRQTENAVMQRSD